MGPIGSAVVGSATEVSRGAAPRLHLPPLDPAKTRYGIESAVRLGLISTWVLVGGAVAAVVALLVRFVWRLPPATRSDLILGGLLVIAGSISFEVVSNLVFASSGHYG